MFEFAKPSGMAGAIIWNYACHPTDFPEFLQVSPEFPGIVRSRLRSEFGDIPILFLQGFAGDVRPPFSGRATGIMGVLGRVLVGPQFRKPLEHEWEEWSTVLALSVVSFSRSAPRTMRISSLTTHRVPVPAQEF